jgi:hypothetical protein
MGALRGEITFGTPSSASGSGRPLATRLAASTYSAVGLTIDGRTPCAPIGPPDLRALTHTNATPRKCSFHAARHAIATFSRGEVAQRNSTPRSDSSSCTGSATIASSGAVV